MKRGALAVLALGMIGSIADTRAADSTKPLEPTIRCPIEVKLDWGDTAIAGGSVTYKYYASPYTALPKGTQLMIYGAGRKVLLPFTPAAPTLEGLAAVGSFLVPADLPAGVYEVGAAVESGARWATASPRQTLTVQPAQPMKLSVVLTFPCSLEPHPPVTMSVRVNSTTIPNGTRNTYTLKQLATTRDANGVTAVTYGGGGPVPVGSVRLSIAPSTPVTAYEGGVNYATSDKCKQHNRTWPDLHGRSTLAGFSTTVNGPLPVVDPSKTAGAVTWSFAPTLDVDTSWGMTEIARSPAPGSVCPSEP